MLRWYIVIVLLLGVTASLVARVAGGGTPTDRVIMARANAVSASKETSVAEDPSIDPLDRGIELRRDGTGYFYADVTINGAPLHMLVDTGATDIALSRNDAQMAGIPTSIGMNDVVGEGADGAVRGQQVVLERVTLGDKSVEGLPAIVLNSGGQSLLGQSFLSKFSSVHIEGDKMVLR